MNDYDPYEGFGAIAWVITAFMILVIILIAISFL
jgi:hypothetical protein